MPSGWNYGQIRMTDTSQHQARIAATGLITAKLIELSIGDKEPMVESMNQILSGDADLIGATTLTLLNLFVSFVTDNNKNMGALKDIVDFLIGSLADDTPQVQRILN